MYEYELIDDFCMRLINESLPMDIASQVTMKFGELENRMVDGRIKKRQVLFVLFSVYLVMMKSSINIFLFQ